MPIYALLNSSPDVKSSEADLIAIAVSVWLGDVAKAWGRSAPVVTFYQDLSLIPLGAPAFDIMQHADQDGVLGFHYEDQGGRVLGRIFTDPILKNGGAVLRGSNSVGVTAAHEVGEAFIDPTVNLYADGPMIAEGDQYAYGEIGDPVEADSYDVKLGESDAETVSVSNFVFPSWYDMQGKPPFDMLGKLTLPFSRDPGGYSIVRDSKSGKTSFVFGARVPQWKRDLKHGRHSRAQRRVLALS